MRRKLAFLSLLTAALAMAGCAQTGGAGGMRALLGASPKKTSAGPSIPSPRERIEAFANMAKRAPSMGPDEQETLSKKLAEAFAKEDDPLIRAQILRTAAMFPTADAANTLKAGLADDDDDVRLACCDAWASRGGPDSTEALAGVLAGDNDVQVRLAAARALADADDPRAVQALGQALEDPNPAMQHRAVASLKSVTGQDLGNDVNQWREYVKNGAVPSQPTSIAGRVQGWFR